MEGLVEVGYERETLSWWWREKIKVPDERLEEKGDASSDVSYFCVEVLRYWRTAHNPSHN